MIEKLEHRRLLAGDVCFPQSPAWSDIDQAVLTDVAAEKSKPMLGPSPISAESRSDERVEGLAIPIVSIFPQSGNEGDSLDPTEIATVSSITPNTLSFTVMLNEPAPGPVSVDVTTIDGSAKGLVVERIASGFSRPTYVTAPAEDFDRLFVIEQRSGIRIVNLNTGTVNPTPFLTIPDLNQNNNEGGLLGLAFHPDYATNGRFFVNMTNDRQPFGDNIGDTFVREYRVSPTNPDVAIQTPVQTILTLEQPFGNHNGGWFDFGPDGYLYIAVGDGGSANDPGNRAQNINSLFGKMLRIDVDGDDFAGDANKNYAIPPSNPFAGASVNGADEIWAYGLRNPYRSSFDSATGDLYIGDVGQGAREEIDFQRADSTGGENYGWRLREGTIATPSGGVGGLKPPGAIDPIYDYGRRVLPPPNPGDNDLRGNSTTGGYVYRGPIDDLNGQYFFGDYVNNRVWGLFQNGDDPASFDGTNYDGFTDWTNLITPDVGSIGSVASFGEDAAGNLYIVDFDGDVFAIRNGVDYVSKTETILFQTNEQIKTFEVPIVYDLRQETDETFEVSLSNVLGATVGNGIALGTIMNDDGTPVAGSIVIDDGTDQRSMIRSLTVTFDSIVDLSAAAFALTNIGTTANPLSTEVTNLIVTSQVVGVQTVATITFGSGASVVDRVAGNTLADGNYQLQLNGAIIFGEQPADNFFRLYGDSDGNGFTDFTDFANAFLPSFGLTPGDAAYQDYLDSDGDGFVDFEDFANGFLPNFGTSR